MSTRERFALTGRSVALDPRHDAVRADLADIRLAARVFAPHYAAPMPRVVQTVAALRVGSDAQAEAIGSLAPGELFEVLELGDIVAWGRSPGQQLVGYVDRTALGESAP